MGVREEAVRVSVSDDFSSEFARMTAAIAATNAELARLDGQHIRVDRSARQAEQGFRRVEQQASRTDSALNSTKGRLGLVAEGLLTLGPAAVTVGGVAVPALVGLATQAGFVTAGIGTMVLAFQGVGDTLDALSKAQLEPTTENLEAARKALLDLSPAAGNFAVQLHDLADEGKQLRDAAAEGFFPGAGDGLEALVDGRLDDGISLLREYGDVMGDISRRSGESLASDRWDSFITYLRSDARPVLTDLAAAAGDVTHGLANLVEMSGPTTLDFTQGIADAADTFDKWSQSADGSEFFDYVQTEGPRVVETIGSVANALLQVGEAAAPIGGPVLEILGSVADVVAAIADSDIGTPLIAGTAALLAFNRALTITNGLIRAGGGAGFLGGGAGGSSSQMPITQGWNTGRAALDGYRTSLARTVGDYTTLRSAGLSAFGPMRTTIGQLRTDYGALRSAGMSAFGPSMISQVRSFQSEAERLRGTLNPAGTQGRAAGTNRFLTTAMTSEILATGAAADRTSGFFRNFRTQGLAAFGPGPIGQLRQFRAEAERVRSTLNPNVRGGTQGRRVDGTLMSPRETSRILATGDAAARAQEQIRGYGAAAARGAAGVAALTLATTGLGEATGTANTAMMGMSGYMVGGAWGAAIGAGVGLVMDLSHANDDLRDSMAGVDQSMRALDFQSLNKQTTTLKDQLQETEDADWFGLDIGPEWAQNVENVLNPLSNVKRYMGDITGASDDAAAKIELADRATAAWGATVSKLGGGGAADDIKAAMKALQISPADLAAPESAHVSQLQDQIQKQMDYAASPAAQYDALAGALRGLDGGFAEAAKSASAFASSLDQIVGPTLNAEQASDAAWQSLQRMGDVLEDSAKKGATSFKGLTTEAYANRDATRQSVADITSHLQAMAASGAGAGRLADVLGRSRKAFIDEGVAAGFSRRQMEARANELKLTPKLVQTVLRIAGEKAFENGAKKARTALLRLDGLSATGRALLRDLASGRIKTVQGLMKRYDMTRAEAIALLNDLASGKIKSAKARLKDLDNDRANPKADLEDNVSPKAHAAAGAIRDIPPYKKSVVDLVTNHINNYMTRRVNEGTGMGPMPGSATGNIFDAVGSVATYARGGGFPGMRMRDPMDRRNNHPPHIAAAGTWRVFGEDETDGEAYIPFRNDHRRPRAIRIWEEAGIRLGQIGGQSFARHAMGYITTPGQYASTAASSGMGVHVTFGDLRGTVRAGGQTIDLRAEMKAVAKQAIADDHRANRVRAGR